jgi:Putative zinc-finger
MSHLDEGTLHALLDGELDLAEVSEVQKHLGSCVACGSRLQEVKQVLAEADRLVGAVEVPAGASRTPRPEPAPTPPPFRGRDMDSWNEPPVLLVPEPLEANARRKRLLLGLRWAAGIGIVLIGGRLAMGAFQPSHPVLPERDLTSAAPAVPPAVVSPEEARAPQANTPQPTVALRGRGTRPQTTAPAQRALARAPVVAEREFQAADQRADSESPESGDSFAAAAGTLAAEEKSDSLSDTAVAALADEAAAQGGRDTAPDGTVEEDQLATRRAAAAALAELDRERRRQRAAAATAALPPPTRAEAATEEPAPRPPTLEQRAQVYLRIGLDEAVKQLGGPVHVIEGMTPQFIGLTRAQLIPGTPSNRPVVRVVYVDARGRLILLDQQRMPNGQASVSPSGSLRWTIGDVMLYLRGEPSTEVLRSLQARVR